MVQKEVPFIDIHTHRKGFRPEDETLLLTYGVHPWFLNPSSLSFLENLLKEDQIVAIGETGLDRLHRDSWPLQLDYFEKHILLSEQYQKPLIIHNVKASAEILHLHKRLQPRQAWIIHGFNGTADEARQFTDRGIYLSVGESLYYPNRKITKSIFSLSLDHLFLETDTSEKTIMEIYDKASALLNIPLDALKNQIFINFAALWKTGNNVPDCSSAMMALRNLDEAMCL